MSTLLIALSITDSQVTASFVRLGSASDQGLTIERETSCTRTYLIETETSPREIIAIWIQCIEDLLHEFTPHWNETDIIDGIAIGLPDVNQCSSFRAFVGLNLRLAFEYGLQELVNRWKKNDDDGDLPAKKQPATRPMRQESTTLRKSAKDFCGGLDNDNEDGEVRSSIPLSRQESYSPDVHTDSLARMSLIEQLSSLPLTFHDSTTCLALGELTYEQNQGYERILALNLNLNTRVDAVFLDHGSIVDHWSSTRESSTLIDARRLGEFLMPYIDRCRPDLLLMGGELARIRYLLEEELNQTLRPLSSVQVFFSLSHQRSICLGAVQEHLLQGSPPRIYRQTDQFLLPAISQDRRYPSHRIPANHRIGVGHRELNRQLCELIHKEQILLIDGSAGTFFDEYAEKLNRSYSEAMKDRDRPSLLFYESDQQPDPKKLSFPCVVIGPGSSSFHATAPRIYIDLPEKELQYRGAVQTVSSPPHPRLKYFIDGQRPLCPTWITGDSLRQVLRVQSSFPPTNNNGLLLSDDQHHLLELSRQSLVALLK